MLCHFAFLALEKEENEEEEEEEEEESEFKEHLSDEEMAMYQYLKEDTPLPDEQLLPLLERFWKEEPYRLGRSCMGVLYIRMCVPYYTYV